MIGRVRRTREVLPLLAVLVLVGLFACQTTSATASGDLSIQVTVDGPEPDGVAADLVLVKPDGRELHIDRSTRVDDLAEGRYRIVAREVAADETRFVASPNEAVFDVRPGHVLTIPFTYAPPLASGAFFPPDAVEIRDGSRAFHLDCAAGDDGASGMSIDDAWRSLDRLADVSLDPGDRVLLRRGCAWTGPLLVPWQGTETWPILIGAYGEGPRPVIKDSPSNHVDVSGSHLIIEQLQAYTSPGQVAVDGMCGDQPVGWRTGFTLQHEARHVTIRDSRAYGNTAGVHITAGASQNRILHNELHDNVIMSVNSDDGGSDDSGAWGIVVNGSDNEIAYNSFGGNNAWCSYDFGNEGASIEIYEGVGNFVHNNVSVDDTTFSELGGSSVRRAANNVFAFNRYASLRPDSQFLIVTGAESRFGPTPGTQAYNNTVYLPHPDQTQGVVCHAGCGPELLSLRNNLLWVGWKALYTDAAFEESHNLFWRDDGDPLLQFFGTEMSSTSRVADPRFVDAAGGDFRLQPDSPAIDAGTNLDLGIDVDVTGVPIPQNGTTDIGAHEFAGE